MTIARKKKSCKKCSNERYIAGKGLCSYCYNMELKKKSVPKKTPRKARSNTKVKKRGKRSYGVKTLKSRLWTVFSRYIRLRDSDEFGYCYCITSGKQMFWKEAQAGHFISRRYNNTLFHEQNVHAQSPFDNCYLAGNQFIYGKRLDEIYGPGTADNILALSRLDKKFSVEELEQMIIIYNKKVQLLLKEKGLSL